jgi:hypothetical protein
VIILGCLSSRSCEKSSDFYLVQFIRGCDPVAS